MTVTTSAPQLRVEERPVDPRSARPRLEALLDEASLRPMTPEDGAGVLAGIGRIGGAPVSVFATDGSIQGGAMGHEGSLRIVRAIESGLRLRCPVIGIWHSGGARLADGVESLDGVGQVFAAMVRASGKIPQLSLVLGPAAGGAAYGPALTDVVVMGPAGRVFVTGPDVVRSVTGEDVTAADLGGAHAHGVRSGVVHLVADSDTAALTTVRRLTELLARPGRFADAATLPDDEAMDHMLPASPRRAYDVHPLLGNLLDEGSGLELQAGWARSITTVVGRLAGRTVGVIANNPLRRGGCLDATSAEKSARFVRMCDSFGIPMVVVVDVPGYLPGVAQEWDGVVRRGAKLLHAFAEARVPRVTLVTRKAYGGAYIAMNSRSLGATAVLAWPTAEVAVMGAQAAVGILQRRALAAAPEHEREALTARLIAEHERTAGGLGRALELGVVDQVIDPPATRRELVRALATAPALRGEHGNIPL